MRTILGIQGRALVKIPLGTKISWILWEAFPSPLTDPRSGNDLDQRNKSRNSGVSRAAFLAGNSLGWTRSHPSSSSFPILFPAELPSIPSSNPLDSPFPAWMEGLWAGEGKGEWDTQGKWGEQGRDRHPCPWNVTGAASRITGQASPQPWRQGIVKPWNALAGKGP